MKKALVVGVDVYRNPSWNLYGCVADAVSISSLLENTYQFKRKNIRVVTNERATKQGILSRLTWLLSEVTAGDTVVFYYAGHGSRIRDRDGDELRDHLDECLVPHDHDWDNALTDDILSEYLQKVPQGCECIVIFDCCLDKDTIIPLLDGTKPTIEELSKRDDEFWVYADNGEGQVIPAKAHSARITGQRTLYEVILDTGETFRCTYDHELLMRDGTYKQLCDIQVGESLMPFNTREGSDLMQLAQDYNHRIVSVTQIEGIHDVYDLTVDTYHNFAIDSGIFVHNCNSGTGTRNVDMSSRETRVRYLPPPADILERSRNSCLETRSFGKVVHTENHILLSACKNDQEAKEIKIRGKSRGVFTYSLEKELIQMPRFSYRELIERVGQSIKEQGVSDQDPQLESPQDRMGLTVFGQTTYSTESHSDEEFLGVVREYFRRFPELKKALHWLFSQDPRYLERLL